MFALPRALLVSSFPSAGADDPGLDGIRMAAKAGASALLIRCRTGADIQKADILLSVVEAEENLPEGAIAILALSDGILPAPRSQAGLAGKSARLAGLAWDHAALAAALGAGRLRDDDGEWTGAFAGARAAVLLSAAAAGIPAYDTALNLDGEAFAATCRRSREDGFFGRLARDTAQVPVIESAYGAAGRIISKTSPASQ